MSHAGMSETQTGKCKLSDTVLTGGIVRHCRNAPEKSLLQKSRKKLLRWLENGCNMDAVRLTVYFANQIRQILSSVCADCMFKSGVCTEVQQIELDLCDTVMIHGVSKNKVS